MKINYKYLIGITLGLLLVFPQSIYAIDIDDMDVTPSSYDFGGVSIDSSKEKRFTIENTSATGSFTIEQLDMTGTDDDQFDVIDDEDCEGKTLDAGEECDIEIAFSPTDEGNMDATLEISIEEDNDVFEVDVEGSGEESDNDVDLSDDSIAFDDTFVDYVTLEKIEIGNNGTRLFTIEDVALQGTDQSEFEVDSRDCEGETLSQDETCTLIVLFQPDTAGSKTAEIEVLVEDDSDEYIVELEGDAITKEDGITVTPAYKDLGEFEDGEKESFSFVVENDLNTAYEITGVQLKDSDDYEIDEDECENTEIDDGTAGGDVENRCDISIDYVANEKGFVVSILEIKTDDPNNDEFNISIWAYVVGEDDYPSDVKGHTFETYIGRLLDAKIVSGFGDGSFKPEDLVTRGQLSKFIYNAFDISEDKSCEAFPDVSITDTFYTEIMSLKCAAIITGFSDGTYKSDDPVTRGEVTKFITKALEKKGIDIDLNKSEDFPDVDDSDKFIIYIAYLSSIRFEGQNIIKGYSDGEFKSLKFITRGEMSKMVDIAMRYYENN